MCRCSLPFPDNGSGSITILTYNVQNIFDAVDNGTEYYEYDPSNGSWNEALYNLRLLNLSEVIKASVKGGPDVVALQEIENLHVAEDLIDRYLKGMGYEDVCVTAKPDSAVQVGIISRIPFDSVTIHDFFTDEYESGRPVLEVKIAVGSENLYLFNNHWKSRLGGAQETEEQRIMSAMVVEGRIGSILLADPGAKIVVAGDLNESHDEYIRNGGVYRTALCPGADSTGAGVSCLPVSGKIPPDTGTLYEPWFNETEREGSYCYSGSWETVDHCLAGEGLFSGNGLKYLSFSVTALPFIVDGEGLPAAWDKEKGTGYSDHLPLLLTLGTE